MRTRIMKTLIAIIILILGFTLLGKSGVSASARQELRHTHKAKENINKDESLQNLPIMIWWTEQNTLKQKSNRLSKIMCGETDSQCLLTGNKNFLKDPRTGGVLFQGTHFKPEDLPLPRDRNHEWVLYHEESPLNNYIMSHAPFLRLFNYTATFRRTSDFPLTLHYIPVDNYFTKRKAVPIAHKNKLKSDKNLASVLYVQSNCEAPSDRDRYIKELMKYIKVDSYGKCLNNRNMPAEFEDPVLNLENPKYLDFIAQYKFHIAFENAFCEDYMTEKLMRPLHLGSIPIYKGSKSALDWMPSNKSIILVDDFESPKALAEFIQKLDDDDSEYESYLEFKTCGLSNQRLISALEEREWRINDPEYPHMISSFECFICEKLSERMRLKEKGIELPPNIADKSHLDCDQPYTLLIDPFEVPKGDNWRKIDWIEMYWQGFDEALAVAEMVRKNESDPKTFNKYYRDILKRRFNR